MKRIILNVALVVLLFSIAPAVLFAQDELTLESLAEAVGELYERVAMIEEKIAPVTANDGSCVQYATRLLQRETVTNYLDTFGENLDPNRMNLQAIRYDAENGLTIYYFNELFDKRSVTETWRGCEFLDVGEWEEED